MFKIVRFPAKLEPFFRSLTSEFHWDHADYFRRLVLLVAFAWGRRNIENLCRHMETPTHRSRYNNFLLSGRYDDESLLRQKAYELLSRVRGGDGVCLILDDSKKRKRGTHMDAVDYVRDCETGKSMRGHQYVVAALKVGHHVIPWGVTLYAKKERSRKLGVTFRKTTEMAADLIRAFDPPKGLRVHVLFDSYYLCKTVVDACREKGFHFLSTLKDNRNLFKNGMKLKAGRYKKNAFRRGEKRSVALARESGRACFTYVDAGWLDVSGLGSLHVIFSRKNGERKILGLVTDNPKLKAKEILRIYSERWSIEVFFKDAKQHLGLGEYQNRPYRAAVRHLHLVCFAYALLTHLRLEGEKGKRKKHAAKKMSLSEAQNELRRLVWQDLTQYLETLPSGDSIVKELSRLLIAA